MTDHAVIKAQYGGGACMPQPNPMPKNLRRRDHVNQH